MVYHHGMNWVDVLRFKMGFYIPFYCCNISILIFSSFFESKINHSHMVTSFLYFIHISLCWKDKDINNRYRWRWRNSNHKKMIIKIRLTLRSLLFQTYHLIHFSSMLKSLLNLKKSNAKRATLNFLTEAAKKTIQVLSKVFLGKDRIQNHT